MTKTNDMKEQQWLCPVRPEEIPKEYNYVAQDKCGEWYGYRSKPKTLDFYFWCINSIPKLLAESQENSEWRNTLTKIPR